MAIEMPQRTELDPITLEMLWSRLISIVEESESTLVRTSFSPIVGEADDHSAALLDRHGNLLAQTPSAMPAFIGILDHTARVLLQHYPVETFEPGDVITTNDPWICCGHLNDLNVMRPIFYKGKVVAFSANTAHLTDIGGRNSAESFDLFEEGLRILPSKLVKAGEPNEEIFKFLGANSRVPDQIIGDINAQLAAAEIADLRLVEMLEEYDLDDLDQLSEEIITRTEVAMRDAISRLPDGEYSGEVKSDGVGTTGPITIRAKLTIHGDSLTIDFDGTSPQVQYGINCPMNLTYAEAVWPVRVALGADIPTTAGSLRPIKVIAPEGCILNPRFPAAVYARTTIVHNAHAPIFQALRNSCRSMFRRLGYRLTAVPSGAGEFAAPGVSDNDLISFRSASSFPVISATAARRNRRGRRAVLHVVSRQLFEHADRGCGIALPGHLRLESDHHRRRRTGRISRRPRTDDGTANAKRPADAVHFQFRRQDDPAAGSAQRWEAWPGWSHRNQRKADSQAGLATGAVR
ncbi:MAG: hydantoinase B/oxoprolinase family protein [Thermomicrobiales bacterium]